MTATADVIEQVQQRIADYTLEGIGESNTKATIISPVLRSLGWDVEDLDEVRLEFKLRPSDKPVDYALLIEKSPRLFVEAKGLGENLADRRWASQIMGYATVAGVKWVVLTNGNEWHIYNSHAAVPVEEKLFRKVSVTTDDDERVRETLALLSRESISQMEQLWEEDFVERQVRDALKWLHGSDGEATLVRTIRRRVPSLKTAEVRSALKRLPVAVAAPTRTVRPVSDVERPPASEPQKERSSPARYEATLAQLIAAGLIQPPLELERVYKGRELRATVKPSGEVSFASSTYRSLSIAAGVARASVIGPPEGRAYHQTNGWTFWRYRAGDGSLHSMDDLRQRFLAKATS